MNGFNVFKAPPFLLEKLGKICSLLRQGKTTYEQFAKNITDKDLRNTMLTLAQESNQFACELSSQIETLGGVPQSGKINEEISEAAIKNVNTDGSEILTLCKKNENKVVAAYREILNDSFLYDGIRKMMGYQLREMLCNFMRLNQLSALKFH